MLSEPAASQAELWRQCLILSGRDPRELDVFLAGLQIMGPHAAQEVKSLGLYHTGTKTQIFLLPPSPLSLLFSLLPLVLVPVLLLPLLLVALLML